MLAKRLLSFLTVCSLLGAGGALLVSPAVIAAGLATRDAGAYWDSLPSELVEPPLPRPSVLYAADGKTVLANLFEYWREPVSHDQIAPIMRTAIVNIEDTRFYTHRGVDPRGVGRALVKGGGRQGASTLTQQYVKNTLALAAHNAGDKDAEAAATARSAERKLREMKYALAVEAKYSKEEILTKYLNIAWFGAGAYGIEAASRRYFSVSADRLTLAQAATLAGLVQDPAGYDPILNPQAATSRRNIVLDRMHGLGTITDAQHAAARASRLTLKKSWPAQGCIEGPAPFFCDWVTTELLRDPRLGNSDKARRQALFQGGLKITTTLDLRANRAATAALTAVLSPTDRLAAAAVTVTPGTGAVRTMAVSRRYGTGPGQTMFPLAASDSFQPGSTFKVFTLAAALERGMPLSTRLPGGDRYTSRLDNPARGYFANAGDGEGSNLTLKESTTKSVNTAFVQLVDRIGVRPVADAAHRAGVRAVTGTGPDAVDERQASLTLGVSDVSVLDMANAYATFAAHGRACTATGVAALRDGTGRARPEWAPQCRQAFTPEVADTLTTLMSGVLAKGGTAAGKGIGRPAVGKTGTTTNYGAAWFAGYTPGMSTAVWMGDPRGAGHPIGAVRGVRAVYGGTWPATIWRDIMTAVPDPARGARFRPANPGYLTTSAAHTARMPAVTGLSAGAARAAVQAAGVPAGRVRFTRAPAGSLWPRDVVTGQSPAAGTLLADPADVTLTVAAP